MRFIRELKNRNINLLRATEWVVSLCTLVGGVYLFSPLYDISQGLEHASAFAMSLVHPAFLALWASILLVGALLVIAGLIINKPQLKSIGWFAMLLARFFQILTTWLAVGLLPIFWIYPFTVMLVMLVLWMNARDEVMHNGD